MRLVYGAFVAARGLYGVNQQEVAIIFRIGGSLGDILDMTQIAPHVRRHGFDLHSRQGAVPARGVVGAALPGVEDRHEPGPLWVAGGGKVAVPGEEPGVDAAQETAREVGVHFAGLASGGFPDPQGRDGVYRRLTEPAGVWRHVCRGAGPVVRAREIALRRRFRIEHDVGHLARRPLVIEKGVELTSGSRTVEPDEHEGQRQPHVSRSSDNRYFVRHTQFLQPLIYSALFHATRTLESLERSANHSNVRLRPSPAETIGSHPRTVHARLMSGHLCLGSSTGSGF